jgi:hypothetical protein
MLAHNLLLFALLHFQIERSGDQYRALTHFAIPTVIQYVEWGTKNPSNFLLKPAAFCSSQQLSAQDG